MGLSKEEKAWRAQMQQYMNMLQQSISQANQPSKWEDLIGNEANSISSFLQGKDYRNLPTGVNVNLLPQAEARRMRQMFRPGQGTAAAGVINPQILAQQQELNDSQDAREWAGAYQDEIGNLSNRKDDLLAMLTGVANNRKSGQVGGYSNLLSAYGAFKPEKSKSGWGQFFGGLGSGLLSMI